MSGESSGTTEVFKALGDPIRWSIVAQMAEAGELAASTLEETLPISKPTISYHVKVLTQAGLVAVQKRGRNYFYSLRGEVLRETLGALSGLLPGEAPERSPIAALPVAAPAPSATYEARDLKAASGDLPTW
ncbi:metalloregulator ArsR/SmtB family transcription factor [Nocardioides sp. YIM 152588]|uniref:ArsR/SmtB family transcription factor n=1 Tax=Nocardioides sp. YIM 152588 TaxID=3158259 RepID=UPI0032E3FF47